jgi:hypothetical protein
VTFTSFGSFLQASEQVQLKLRTISAKTEDALSGKQINILTVNN